MAIYTYIKEKRTFKKQALTILSYLSLFIGSVLLFWALYPIISFEIYTKYILRNKFFSPIKNKTFLANSFVIGEKTVLSSNLRDFTQANLWFPTADRRKQKKLKIKKYYLSIPKLNIINATVTVGGNDLSKSLVHYLPHSLPGEEGNITIFGHSTLPQLYNPHNYKTIFTYLPSLNKGDKIYLKVNNLEYEYQVYEMFVIKPDNVSVLNDIKGGSYLTLITCVPPGTFWKRLVVRAKLTHLPTN